MLSTLDGDGLLPCDLAKAAGVFGVQKRVAGGTEVKENLNTFLKKKGMAVWYIYIYFFAIGGENAGLIEDLSNLYFFSKKTQGFVFDYNLWTRRLPKYDAVTIFWNRWCGSAMSNVTLALVVRPATGPVLGVKGERILGMAITPGKEEVYSSGN